MTPTLRTMPTITATRSGKHWLVALPDGTQMTAIDADQVRRIVARHAPGSAIRWEGTR